MPGTIDEDWFVECSNYDENIPIVGKCIYGGGEAAIDILSDGRKKGHICIHHLFKLMNEYSYEIINDDGGWRIIIDIQITCYGEEI